MSKNEIRILLGEPTRENNDIWNYDLGPTGRGINYGSLEFNYEDEICQSIKIYQH